MKKFFDLLETIYVLFYFAIGLIAFPVLYLITFFMRVKTHYEESGYDY
jgi:hypothetical protein